jgi:hypothetical protein
MCAWTTFIYASASLTVKSSRNEVDAEKELHLHSTRIMQCDGDLQTCVQNKWFCICGILVSLIRLDATGLGMVRVPAALGLSFVRLWKLYTKCSVNSRQVTHCNVFRVWLLVGVWIRLLDLLTPYAHHSELQVLQRYRKSPHLIIHWQRLMSSVCYSLHLPLTGNRFSTV